jgi:cystathionine gamma-synthase/cystathionine gamma-lyase/cystathionine beta-lyase
MHPDTLAVHGGFPAKTDGALVTPIFQSSTYEYAEDAGPGHAVRYLRYSNTPNHEHLAEKLAALEGAESALVTGSGMAAISAALLSTLGAGDHLLVQDSLYGGTFGLITAHLSRLGIEHTFIDAARPGTWEARRRPNTRAVYVEAISNPLVRVPALRAAAEFSRAHGLVSMIDATFATPLHLRPISLGFDLVLHSATKYLGGHSDLCAGVVAGSRERVGGAMRAMRAMGGSLDANSCFLLDRGLKTLHLRMPRHAENAKALASWLAGHPRVARVHHPSLMDLGPLGEPYAGFGGMLSFELAGGDAMRFLRSVRVATHAASLGGTETLVVSPVRTSHASLTPAERAAAGITDGLIRVSAGVEHIDDLRDDFERAIAAAFAS